MSANYSQEQTIEKVADYIDTNAPRRLTTADEIETWALDRARQFQDIPMGDNIVGTPGWVEVFRDAAARVAQRRQAR